ncbi:hypothetical protein OSTOST_19759 [Ostertagia ostertagi]
MPPLLGSISSLPTTSESKYEQYFLSKAEPRPSVLTRRQVGGALISIGILGFLLKILIWNRPVTYYDRASDPLLLQFVYTSPAARRLPRSGQLFCWVQTAKIYHDTRPLTRRGCRDVIMDNCLLEISSHPMIFPYSTVFAGIPDSYYNLFFKSRYAFFYIYHYISKDFDWYMKEKNGYNAGEPLRVARAAVKIFNEMLYDNETLCPDDIYEDVGIGRCLASVGIFPHDTRNSRGQNRFNTHTPSDVFHATQNNPTWTYFKAKKGYEAFASDFISFHHLTPDEIRLFDILLYRTNRPPSNRSHKLS